MSFLQPSITNAVIRAIHLSALVTLPVVNNQFSLFVRMTTIFLFYLQQPSSLGAPSAILHLEYVVWHGDGAGNTIEENSSVFSLI